MSSGPVKITIAFDEADGEGIVFFGNYFRLAHRALEQFIPSLGISWQEWFANSDWGVPLRHVEADYLQPLRPGDDVAIEIKIVEVGESSVVFSYEFRDNKEQTAARLKTAHVFANRQTFKKQNIPDSIRERLTKPV